MKLRILMATAAVGLVISGVAIAATSPAANSNSSIPTLPPAQPTQMASTTTTTTTAPANSMSMSQQQPSAMMSQSTTTTTTTIAPNGKTIMDLANSDKEFSTLASALKSTGLDQTLASKGSITVFAPTNAAFAKLGPQKLNELMKPENKAQLSQILTYHVVPQPLPAQAPQQSASLTTAEGQPLMVTREATGYQVQNAKSLGAPMAASNGSIIAIDSVLMPEASAKMGMGAPTSATSASAQVPTAAMANPNAALPSSAPMPASLTKTTTTQTTTTTTTAPAAPIAR